MQEFMYFFRGGEAMDASQSPEAMQKSMEKWSAWMQQLAEQGKFIAGQPLQASGTVLSGKSMTRTDKPFAEGKEIIGGYLIIRAKDQEEAVELSKGCPIFERDGHVEIRSILQVNM